jgi:hypothetical protein
MTLIPHEITTPLRSFHRALLQELMEGREPQPVIPHKPAAVS